MIQCFVMDSGGLSSKSDSVCVLYRTMSSDEDGRSARECEEHCKVSMYKVMNLPHIMRWLGRD